MYMADFDLRLTFFLKVILTGLMDMCGVCVHKGARACVSVSVCVYSIFWKSLWRTYEFVTILVKSTYKVIAMKAH